jgi:Tfp pilus assembly protein PilV
MKLSRRTHHKTNKGFSLIELLFSLFILTFGILAAMTMVIVGVSRNGSNRFDTTATNVAQTVLEEISGTAPTANPTLTVTDCTGANLQINTAAGGAKLLANGYIDFTQAAATLSANNYQMNYTVCGSNG